MHLQALLALLWLVGNLELCTSLLGRGGGGALSRGGGPSGGSSGGNPPTTPSDSGRGGPPPSSPTSDASPSVNAGGGGSRNPASGGGGGPSSPSSASGGGGGSPPPRPPSSGGSPSVNSGGGGGPSSLISGGGSPPPSGGGGGRLPSPGGGGGPSAPSSPSAGGGPPGSTPPRSPRPTPLANPNNAQPTTRPTIANCDQPEVKLETFLSVDGPGYPARISQQDLDVLQEVFRNTYNFLSVFNCDALHRRVEEVEIQVFDFPPSGDDAPVKVELIFRVEFSCRGEKCSQPAQLFSLSGGFLGREDLASTIADIRRAGGRGNRDLVLDDPCQQCRTNFASNRSPTPRQFVDFYRARVEARDLPTLTSVMNVLEIEEKPCPTGSYEAFNETVNFELEGDPENITEADLQLLGNTFLSSYNYYSDVQCDGRYLKVEQIEVFNDPILTDPSVRHLATTKATTYSFYLKALLAGTCRGCKDSKSLFKNDATKRERFRRTLLERTGLRGRFLTEREFMEQQHVSTGRQSRRTQRLIALPDFTLSEFRTTMESSCVSCPAPSSSPSSLLSRMPGAKFFDSDSCFCAKKGPDFKNTTVGFDDAFNTTFSKEKGDDRYKGLQGYRGISSGNKGNGGSGGSRIGSGSGSGGSGSGGSGSGGSGSGGSGSGGSGSGGSGSGGSGSGGSGSGGSGSGGNGGGTSRTISSNAFWS